MPWHSGDHLGPTVVDKVSSRSAKHPMYLEVHGFSCWIIPEQSIRYLGLGLYCYAERLPEKPRGPPSIDYPNVDGAHHVSQKLPISPVSV